MATILMDMETGEGREGSRYRIKLKTGLFYIRPAVLSVYYDNKNISFNELTRVDATRYEILGCYNGPLEEGYYPIGRKEEIMKDTRFDFVEGGRVVIHDMRKNEVTISRIIMSVKKIKISEPKFRQETEKYPRRYTPIRILDVKRK